MKNIIAIAVVLSCATAAVAQSYLTPSGPYPYPGNPYPQPGQPGGNPPPYNPPGQPPYNPPGQQPPYGGDCKLEYTGNYYYVSRNGTRFSDLMSTLQQALNVKEQMRYNGSCNQYDYPNNAKCDIEYTGNYYYVSRNGSRFTELSSNLQSSLNQRDQLYRANECGQQTYQPSSQCKVEYTGNYYYVSRNGSRFSDLTSSLQQATATRDNLVRNYICQAAYQSAPCRLEYTGNYYYISINSSRASDLTPNLDLALRQQQDFASRGMCSSPQAVEQCRVDYTGNYYYVSRNGSRISDLKQDYYIASQIMYSLQSSRNCY